MTSDSRLIHKTLQLLLLWGSAALFPGCELILGEAPVNCDIRRENERDPLWECRKASRWEGRCIPPTHFDRWSCLELDVDAQFCPSAEGAPPSKYNVTVLLRHNDKTLDCNNQFIDHNYPFDQSVGAGATAAIRAPNDRSVSNVRIKNCHIRNVVSYGVDLKRYFRGADLTGPMVGHSNISIDQSSIESTGQIGIFVGHNSTGISITRTKIRDTFSGIYLEAGTSQSLISEVEISESRDREAIAVDSSHHNIIEKSRFFGNPGAIFLYKNCGETTGSICPISRPHGASNNIIRDNTFEDDRVEVASRQWQFYGLGWCSDTHGNNGRWRDRASDNVIEGNTFINAGLILQDEPVYVRNNVFDGSHVDAGVRTPPTHSPLKMTGEFTFNIFKNGGGFERVWRNNHVNDMIIQNNMNESGECAAFNQCPDLAAFKAGGRKAVSNTRLPAKEKTKKKTRVK